MNPSILYNDKITYRGLVGIVKNVKGSYAEVKFDGVKRHQLLPVSALEKVDGNNTTGN